jgi:nucleoid-associated protein YgaU
MPQRKKQAKTTWQDNYAGLILGAIIVVILGLLVANFFSKRNQEIGNGANTSQAQEQQAENPTQYKVESGDSLSKISEKLYGSQDMWPILARVNNIANPSLIYAGNNLEIPSKEKAAEIKTQMTQTTYQVQAGDTLFKIAEKMYGDGSKWVLLDKANNVGRLPNGNPLIFAGNTLTVPR